MPLEIISADTQEQLAAVRGILMEYEITFVNFPDAVFRDEIDNLPGKYAPPQGMILMAISGSDAAGCIAIRPIGEGICEIKRFFVRPAFRKQGIGESLLRQACATAKKMGYATVRLDSLKRLVEADKLFRKLGFFPIPPYNDTPIDDIYYLELDLTNLPNEYASS